MIEAGLRRENSLDTLQMGLTVIEDLKLEYSTGFKAPSLAQLYSPFYGNPDLAPEESETVNLAYEKKWTDQLMTSISVFDSSYKNLIIFVASKATNLSATRVQGSEVAANYMNSELGINLQFFLGYQEPHDTTTGTWLPKRPLRSAGAKVTQFFNGDDASLTLEVNHVGERRDLKTRTSYTTVNQYTIANLAGNYKLSNSSEVFARIDNVTNQTYEQAYGYYDYGIKGRVGFQIGY